MSDISSSQETLPLSQESFFQLWNLVPENIRNGLLDDNNIDKLIVDSVIKENAAKTINQPEQTGAAMTSTSCLPSINDFPGFYNFKVQPPISENVSKASPFTFSNLLNKLYVKKDESCPFYFSTSEPLERFYIRAMVFFSSPEHIKDTVIRCFNHAYADQEKGDNLSEHLVRCEGQGAGYYKDLVTQRLSVCVPYERPAAGQNGVTYRYKFKCYTSCSGGPNRRPFSVVFQLENNQQIFGRCKIDLKVCSCPYRDREVDENKRKNCNPPPLTVSTLGETSTKEVSKKRRHDDEEDTDYVIKVQHKECYNLLKAVKKFFYLNKCIKEKNWSPNVQDVANLLNVLTSSGEDEK